MVIVNSVVYVRGLMGQAEADLAIALAAFGGGSMVAVLLLPRLLARLPDRAVMLPGAGLLTAALFAAYFSLSHACWLVTYPLAGWLGADVGLGASSLALGGLAAFGVLAALLLSPRHDPEAIAHSHDDLPPDHPHVRGGGKTHSHPFVIDYYQRHWPEQC